MRSINLEGGDKVGKHTATIASIKILLLSNYKVVFTDFPQYWFFGAIIRHVLRTPELNKACSLRDIEIKCALYAVDRLLSLLEVDPYILEKDTILVSDRGWASNAVTLAYALANNQMEQKNLPYLIKNLSEIESEYISILNPHSILLSTGSSGKNAIEKGEHISEDIHEEPITQQKLLTIYRDFLLLDEVYTQHNGVWRKPIDIAKDILNIMEIKFQEEISEEDLLLVTPKNILKQTNMNFISPISFLPKIYGDEWNNVKNLFLKNMNNYLSASWTGDTENLRLSEHLISNAIFQNPPSRINIKIPSIVQEGLNRNLNSYPEIEDIISKIAGDKFKVYFQKILNINVEY